MQKNNDHISMDYSERLKSPVTKREIQSYRELCKTTLKASNSVFAKTSIISWLFLGVLYNPIVLDISFSSEHLGSYLLVLLVLFPIMSAFFGAFMADIRKDNQRPKFTWNVKSNNRVGFQDGIKQLSDNEYIELKALADQDGSVMNYVKTIASQGRKPIKAELCMLKNYMDQYPSTHAKQVLGLA